MHTGANFQLSLGRIRFGQCYPEDWYKVRGNKSTTMLSTSDMLEACTHLSEQFQLLGFRNEPFPRLCQCTRSTRDTFIQALEHRTRAAHVPHKILNVGRIRWVEHSNNPNNEKRRDLMRANVRSTPHSFQQLLLQV
jgi:hypothetical protein